MVHLFLECERRDERLIFEIKSLITALGFS